MSGLLLLTALVLARAPGDTAEVRVVVDSNAALSAVTYFGECDGDACHGPYLGIDIGPAKGAQGERLLAEMRGSACWQALLTIPGHASTDRVVGCFGPAEPLPAALAYRGQAQLSGDQWAMVLVATRIQFTAFYTDLSFASGAAFVKAADQFRKAVEARGEPPWGAAAKLPPDILKLLDARRMGSP